MAEPGPVGPDLVIAGAARSGTSSLTAHLAAHPRVDPGTVKEPNYFSRHYDRGAQWYDGLFTKRSPGVLRLDASTSYTYPQFPEALARLAEASPEVFVVYLVRDPVARAVSHYLFYRHYFRREQANDFGTALRAGSYYTDVSDYARWLAELRAVVPEDRLLVVPFGAVTRSSSEVVSTICTGAGLADLAVAEDTVKDHQNHVVEFRTEGLRRAVKSLRRNPTYLGFRSAVGPHRIRRLRALLTRTTTLPSVEEAVASCDDDQLRQLRELESRARSAVYEHLKAQDLRRGLGWARHWEWSDSVVDRAARLSTRGEAR